MYLFYENMGFKPLDTTSQIENLVSYMFVIQDIYLSELLSTIVTSSEKPPDENAVLVQLFASCLVSNTSQ